MLHKMQKCIYVYKIRIGRDSVVCIVSRYKSKDPRIESRWGGDFLRPSRSALESVLLHIKWVPGLSRRKSTGRLSWKTTFSIAEVKKKSRDIHPLPFWALVACCWVKFTLYKESGFTPRITRLKTTRQATV
jgi:hypothetical protein